MNAHYDAAVIGGGFFGCAIADYLSRRTGSVLLVEQEADLFQHASYSNQARIHNGYHYPRSLHTAYRSHVNFKTFTTEFPGCVENGFTKLYCIAAHNSKVTPRQFERFCTTIGAPWQPAAKRYRDLFDPRLIAAVYEVTEYAFNSFALREVFRERLHHSGVDMRLGSKVEEVSNATIRLANGDECQARYIFNCTYSGLKRVPGIGTHCRTELKQEITEMVLIEPPEELRGIGVTVMCGPFFSAMPFPARPGLHSLSHVRYTPHCSWVDNGGPETLDPYDAIRNYDRKSNGLHMLKDAQRYLPALAGARIVDSLFEVKTLLLRNEIDDGRPILMERSSSMPNLYSIMGGKLDNIYDVIERLEAEIL